MPPKWKCPARVLLLVSCSSACGGKTEAESGSPNASVDSVTTKEQFLDATIEILCSIRPCYQDSPLTKDECIAQTGTSFRASSWATFGADYDAAEGTRCIRAMSAADCVDFLTADEAIAEACVGVFAGDKTAGEICAYDECQVGSYCDESQACPGTCRALPQQGEACTSDCAVGLTCIGDELDADRSERSPGRCETRAAEGAQCGDEFRECQGGLTCDESTMPALCRPFYAVYPGAKLGETCKLDTQCGTGMYCTGPAASRVCAKQIAAGGACDDGVGCELDLYCRRVDDVRSCAARVDVGAQCDSSQACKAGFCLDGICQAQHENGVACSDDALCYSFNCELGVCAPQPSCEPMPNEPAPTVQSAP